MTLKEIQLTKARIKRDQAETTRHLSLLDSPYPDADELRHRRQLRDKQVMLAKQFDELDAQCEGLAKEGSPK